MNMNTQHWYSAMEKLFQEQCDETTDHRHVDEKKCRKRHAQQDKTDSPATISSPSEIFADCSIGERSGSVVECLTRDRGARVGASPASLYCFIEQDTLILA